MTPDKDDKKAIVKEPEVKKPVVKKAPAAKSIAKKAAPAKAAPAKAAPQKPSVKKAAPKAAAKGKVLVKLVKSQIGSTDRQRSTVKGLGLGKINSTKVLEDTPAIRGMITKVAHLVTVEAAK